MKKRLPVFVLIGLLLVLLCVFGITASAHTAESDIADTGAAEDITDTGVTKANLGSSFYARVSIEEPERFLTIPENVMNTTQLKAYADKNTQIWHFTRQSDGSYKIRNVEANLYIELYSNQPKENNEVFHTDEDDLPDQRWILQPFGNGYQIVTCCNTNFMLKAINLYGTHAEVVISQDKTRVTTRFIITKVAFNEYLPTPTVTLTNAATGVNVKWNKVSGATNYSVMRYNTTYKRWDTLSNTAGTSYVDKTAVSGTTYQYSVKCIAPKQSLTAPKSIQYIAPPTVGISNSNSGPVISWSKPKGAVYYRLFYKTTGTSTWKTLTTIKTSTYTHTAAAFNVSYTYMVRCMTSDIKSYTSAATAGVENRIVKTPTYTVTLNPKNYKISWSKVGGASRYRVYYKSKATNWSWKSVVCTGTAYTYSSVTNKEDYYFMVRCLDDNNRIISGYKESAKYTFYSAPVITKFTSTSSSNKLTWGAISGAAKYRVFSWNGQKWVKRKDVTTTSATIPVEGTKKQNACFAIRCMDKNGNFISSYYETVLVSGKIKLYAPGGYTSTHKF